MPCPSSSFPAREVPTVEHRQGLCNRSMPGSGEPLIPDFPLNSAGISSSSAQPIGQIGAGEPSTAPAVVTVRFRGSTCAGPTIACRNPHPGRDRLHRPGTGTAAPAADIGFASWCATLGGCPKIFRPRGRDHQGRPDPSGRPRKGDRRQQGGLPPGPGKCQDLGRVHGAGHRGHPADCRGMPRFSSSAPDLHGYDRLLLRGSQGRDDHRDNAAGSPHRLAQPLRPGQGRVRGTAHGKPPRAGSCRWLSSDRAS